MFSGLVDLFNEVKMIDFKGIAKRFHEDETGQGMTEYIIIIVLVAILVLVMVKAFGSKIKNLFKKSTDTLGQASQSAFGGN